MSSHSKNTKMDSPKDKETKENKEKEKDRPFVTTTQISKPYLTSKEIKYLQSKTILDITTYNQRKNQIYQFLFNLINKLKFPIAVLETSMNYYQRFYLYNKFEISEYFEVCLGCLFLSIKNEDTIKKLKDIIVVSNGIRDIPNSPENIEHTKKQVLNNERRLLEISDFNFLNVSVLEILIKFCKKMKFNYNYGYLCYILFVDSIQTDICLKVPPHCIALSIIIISTRLPHISTFLKETDKSNTTDTDNGIDQTKTKINPKTFNCPEILVNESIFQILNFYINQYNYSNLSTVSLINLESAFINIKVEFSKLKGFVEVDERQLEKDESLAIRDYNISFAGGARFMLGNKRRRFDKELV